MTPSLVDVIVPNWNGERHLEKCLGSLGSQTYPRVHPIVVDNGSTDGSVALVGRRFPQATVIEVGFNSGFAGAVNRGIRAGSGEYVALLNNDAFAHENWIAEMVETMENDAALGSCACKMLLAGRPHVVNAAGIAFNSRFDACSRVIGWGRVDTIDFARPRLVLSASGGAALYRRRALEIVDLLDEDYFLYYEDFDLGLRLQLAGFDCLYVPTALVYHDDEAIERAHPGWVLRLNRRNSRWTAIKSLPAGLLARIAVAEAVRGRSRSRGRGGDLSDRPPAHVPPLEDAAIGTLLRKRRKVQSHRKLSWSRFREKLRSESRPYLRQAATLAAEKAVYEKGVDRPRIALLAHTAMLGGAEMCLLRLAAAMHEQGRDPLVLLPGDGPLAAELHRLGVRMAIVPMRWWAYPEEFRPGVLRLLRKTVKNALITRRVLRSENIDVVGTVSSVVPQGAIAARLAGLRHVWHVRELYPHEFLRPVFGLRTMLYLIERLADRIIVPSERVGRMFRRSSKVSEIAEGIDVRFFETAPGPRPAARTDLGLPAEEPMVLVLGPVVAAKDPIAAVRAVAGLTARGLRVRLVVCGELCDDGYRAVLSRAAEDLGIAERVHLLGFRRDVVSVLDAADVLLVPSRQEAFGMTVVEAMARGVPVVATRCGGPEELIEDGVTGFLVDVGDSEAMAARIAALFSDTGLRGRLVGAARAHAQIFRPEHSLAATLRCYLGPN